MHRHGTLALILLVALAAVTGCGRTNRYVERRAADFMDMFVLELTPAFGMEMHMQFLCFGSALGYADSPFVGPMMHGRRIGFGKRHTWGYLVRGRTLATQPLNEYSTVIGGRSRAYEPNHDYWGFGAFKHQGPRMTFAWLDWPELFDVSMGGTLGLVQMHMGINMLEGLDFMLGFLELDIALDDVGRRHNRARFPTGRNLPFLEPHRPGRR